MSRLRAFSLAALILGLFSSPGSARGQEPPAKVPVQWDKVTRVSKTIPTLQVVDDTFTKYRDAMAAIIARAKTRAGIT